MKAESTIRKEMEKLSQIIDNDGTPHTQRLAARNAECALYWALEKCDWVPSGLIRKAIDQVKP